MSHYEGLAAAYDYLVQGVDFEGWIDYVEQILDKFNVPVSTVADLACGTGNTTIPFARRGYRATGIDLAPEMLAQARQKAKAQNLSINFVQQDMRMLNLTQKFDLITCFHDGLNYLLSLEELKKTFTKVHNHLFPGGLFIFDLNAITWLSESNTGTTYIDEPELTIIWESSYDHAQLIWQINVTGFVRQGDYYKKFKEIHREKGYTPEQVKPVLKQSGLSLLDIYDAFSFIPPSPNSRRHFYVARRDKNRGEMNG